MKSKKRKQILEISEKLFNRFGIRRTGVDEIARLADVAKGTIYNYFGDKEGLFRALAMEKLSLFEEILDKSIVNIRDPLEKLKLTALNYLKVSIDNPFLSDKLLYGNYEEKIRRILVELEEKTRKILGNIVEGIDPKKLPEAEKKAVINTLLFTLKGMMQTVRDKMEPVSMRMFETEIDYLVKSLLPNGFSKKTGG